MDVTVYTTSSCPHCRTAKRFLSQRGIRFRERDVSRDRAAAMEMVRRSGQQGVPVITIDDEVIVGFDRRRLEEILSRPPRPRPSLGATVAGAGAIARKRGLSLPAGAYVGGVKVGSPAEQAGLREGDVILALSGVSLRGAKDLKRVLSSLRTGQSVDVVWWRGGREVEGRLQL